jgi:uncharacterized membrane protein YdjX (TVP38/TMEM64 family)
VGDPPTDLDSGERASGPARPRSGPPGNGPGASPQPGSEPPRPAPPAPAAVRPGLLPVAVTLGAILLAAAVLVAIPAFRDAAGNAIGGDTEALRADLSGAGGVIVVLVLSLLHAVFFYPAEILDAAVGYVYGFWAGLALVMVGWMLNGYVSFQIGRHGARPLLHRLVGAERFDRYEAMVGHGGVPLLLAMRLIPVVPFTLFSYAAGAARVPLWTFMWTTAIGYLPLTAVFVLLGSRLEELHPTDPLLIGSGIVLTAVLFAAHRYRDRLFRQTPAP